MWSKLFILPLLLSSIEGKTVSQRKKVCVIGAGVSGLATVKRLAKHIDEFEPIVFEKNSDVGGLWIYGNSTSVDEHGSPVHSSIYRNLRSNVPKELMAWPDYRKFTSNDERSSVPHHLLLEYLRNYTDHFHLRQYLNTLVEHVAPLNKHKDWQKTEWLVKTRNLNTQERQEIVCNAIAICNGHTSKLPSNIEQVPGVVSAKGNELILSNGTSVISDAFIYCTGYLPEFPFLNKTSGIKVQRARVFPLYKQMINAENPSMAIIGLPSATSTWLLPYVQSQYFVSLLQGKVKLSSYENMISDAKILPAGAKKGKYHDLADNQWVYNEDLATAGHFELPPSYYKGGLHLYNAYRTTHLANFRRVLFRLHPNGTFYPENTE